MWVSRSSRARSAIRIGLFLVSIGATSTALARPEAPGIFCETYPNAAECAGRVVQCRMCHDSTYPPAWNKYGLSIIGQMQRDVSFAQALPKALEAVAEEDADSDGVMNLEEIKGGTFPGDAQSFWKAPAAQTGPDNPSYRVGAYDLAFAYRRASVLYCGQSPSFDEMQALRADNAKQAQLRAQLHERLDTCLHSAYWRNEGLKRLADNRIRPAKNAGNESNVMIGQYRLVSAKPHKPTSKPKT